MPGDVRPLSEEHLREVVAYAIAANEPLEVRGLGSRRGFGRPVHAKGTIDLSGFTGVSLYEPEELVMVAGAATPLAEVEATLKQRGQQLAFEPPRLGRFFGRPDQDGSIGGIFACNLAGPRRFKAGAARDHLLGFRGVSGRAEIFKGGGRVMKNVTGYDLCKLMAGSFGTLTALTEVTFKVLPAPEKLRTVLALGLTADQSVQALAAAAGSPHEVSGLSYLPAAIAAESTVDFVRDAGTSVTAIRVEGPGPSVAYRTEALRRMLAGQGSGQEELHTGRSDSFWAEVRDVAPLLGRDRPVWRLSVTPGLGGSLLDRLCRDLGADGYLDAAGGTVWLAVDAKLADGGAAAIRAALGPGGHATLLRGPDGLRSRIEVFQPQPGPVAALTRRIKEGFDPKGVLNPGRMYDGV
ncbi:MAG: FAD-binding protein [Pseudomonadota bacterium]|nr:FAD-binding protein [Pseudomonadota bacterium]